MITRFFRIIISKIRKEPYDLNSAIPKEYLLKLGFSRLQMLLRGFFIFPGRRKNFIFVGSHTKIKCRSKLKTEKYLTISQYCYIDALSENGIQLGNNVSIGRNTTIECTGSLKFLGKGLVVGNNVGMGTHGFFGCAGGIEIGDDTIFGNFVSMHSENHNFDNLQIPIRLQGVNHRGIKIGCNCWIGSKVTILDGVNIGNGCIIAAGSVVVSGNYDDNKIYGGVPAKVIKNRD